MMSQYHQHNSNRGRRVWSIAICSISVLLLLGFGVQAFGPTEEGPSWSLADETFETAQHKAQQTGAVPQTVDAVQPAFAKVAEAFPSIATIPGPEDLQRQVDQCMTLCGSTLPAPSAQVVYGPPGSNMFKESPYLVRQTNQFALGSIMNHRISAYQRSDMSARNASVQDADFVYIDVEVAQGLRKCIRCMDKRRAAGKTVLDTDLMVSNLTRWFLQTVESLRHRRQWHSTLTALSRIGRVYSTSLMSPDVLASLDDAIVFGIEGGTGQQDIPSFINTPYPTRFHLPLSVTTDPTSRNDEIATWHETKTNKPYLIHFGVGRLKVMSGRGTRLRKALAADLEQHRARPDVWLSTTLDSMISSYRAMGNSTFCLEPTGDSPTRRGFTDSILLGCIPVIFDTDAYGKFADLDLNSLAHIIPFEEYMTSNRSVADYLRAVSPEEIRRKQNLIAKHAHLFQWAYPDSQAGQQSTISNDAFGHIIKLLQQVKGAAR